MALSMPLSLTSCNNTEPKQISQSQTQEEKYFQVEAKLRDSEEKLEEKTKDYFALEKEKRIIADERDKLVHERGEYPRNTSDDIIKENKCLRLQLLKNDVTSSIGYRSLNDMLEDNRTLRVENWKLKRENQSARNYLEVQGIYLSEVTGKKADFTQSPLYLEKAEHKTTRGKLKLIEEEGKAARIFYELETLKKDQELAKTINERDLYRTGYEQWRNYAKSLETPKLEPKLNPLR